MGRIRLGMAMLAFAAGAAAVPAAASAAVFSNPTPIAINDYPSGCSTGPDSARATPYPSSLVVSGQPGRTTDVNATIVGFTHAYPADVRVLLVGPQGQTTDLMDEVGSSLDASNATLTFDDSAANPVPDPPVSGTFRPTQSAAGCGLGPTSSFPSPAPAAPYGTLLSAFNGTNPNGTWSLYVVDDSSSDSGFISGGWSLDLSAVPTGQRAAALKKCKKKAHKKHWSKKRLHKCKKKARRLPI